MTDPAGDGIPPAHRALPRLAWQGAGATRPGDREIAEETAVALTYGGSTYAVMMATPRDLMDFAVGFSLTERIVARPDEIESIAVVPSAVGLDLQMWLAAPRSEALASRRRHLAGPTGCGLCGIDSLTEAMRPAPAVGYRMSMAAGEVVAAMAAVPPRQELNRLTAGAHAAALWRRDGGLAAVREDVGRHNALDKLVGALARQGEERTGGALVLTSRVSVEMVQKAAVAGLEIVVAASAPTALAVRTAEQAGITLIGIARADGFEIFAHPERIRA